MGKFTEVVSEETRDLSSSLSSTILACAYEIQIQNRSEKYVSICCDS